MHTSRDVSFLTRRQELNLLFTDLNGKCGDIMTQPSGNLITNDGDNDGYYDNNQDCVWTVIAPPTKVIRLEFHTFELEGGSGCKHDYVRVSINPGKETPSKRAHAVEMTPDRRQYDKVITTHRHWHNRLITTS